MNHDGHSPDDLSEADVIHLLSTYGDALEANAAIPSAPVAPTEPIVTADTVGVEFIDFEAAQPAETKSGRGRLLVGALAAAAVLVVGGVIVANQNDRTERDVVAGAIEQPATEDESGDSGSEPADESNFAASGAASSASSDSSVSSDLGPEPFGFGPGSVIFNDGEFVSLGSSGDGVFVARSSNGTDWSTSPIGDFPDGATANLLARTETAWVTVVEVWPEVDEASTPFFGSAISSDRFLATSADLENWTLTEFPELDLDPEATAFTNDLASSGDRLAVLLNVQPPQINELQVLFEAGVVSESDLENYCGFDSDGDVFVGRTCSFSEEGPQDAIPDDIGELEVVPSETTTRSEREELFRLEPGDPGYDELSELFNSESESLATSIVVSGPVDGPFETAELPGNGFGGLLSGSDQGFVATTFGEQGAEVTYSVDGVTWSDATAVDFNLDSFVVVGDRIVAPARSLESPDGAFEIGVSDDFGATWTTIPLGSELFGAYGVITAGPAGFALGLEGALEPFVDPFAEAGDILLENDGFTMSLGLNTGFASLMGPNGEVIHESVQLGDAGGSENTIRFEGLLDEVLIWLDPITGEDLVTFNESDFDEAFAEAFGEDVDTFGSDIDGPQERGFEIWFSVDGLAWELLESNQSAGVDSSSSVVGVGDDELIVRTNVAVVPPDELLAFEQEGRQATPEEIEALDSFFAEGNETSVQFRSIPIG